MRVRETAPTFEEFLAWSGWADMIDAIAEEVEWPRIRVVTAYLSKVGTWRQFCRNLPECFSLDGAKIIDNADVQSQFWESTWPALDGAPEWLRETYILTVADLIDDEQIEDLEEAWTYFPSPPNLP